MFRADSIFQPAKPRQRGAALITGLVLLMVMTVLAISTMSTAGLELMMAGNAQYREYAFQLAESGIETGLSDYRRGLRTGEYLPLLESDPPLPATEVEMEKGRSVIEIRGNGPTLPIRCEASMGEDQDRRFSDYHMQVRSTATTEVRNARSVHTQGFVICGLAL